MVYGIANTQQGLQNAVAAVATALTAGVDVGSRTVPLKSVTAKRLGPDKALVSAEFRYTFLNTPSAPGDTEFTDIRYQVTEMRVPVYRSTRTAALGTYSSDAQGLPAGDMIGCEPETAGVGTVYAGRPVANMWAKTAVQIVVYGLDDDPPAVEYVTANKKVNGANNTIAGIVFAAGELRLDGIQCERIVQYATNGTTSYKYVYAATYTAAENFYQQVAYRRTNELTPLEKSVLGNVDVWGTYNDLPHETYDDGGGVAALPVPAVA